ncbi:MAG: hypothetical protein E5X60_10210 [Mesorhizobium sp.]|nr:MAG: hypothetical protein E5X60_10210 [Mesorhizobium sp.]
MPGFFVCRQVLKKKARKQHAARFRSSKCFAGTIRAGRQAQPLKTFTAKYHLSKITFIFQKVVDGHPQLVHIGCEGWGTIACQENYLIKFRAMWPFSHSPEKGLNHNGFVKTSQCNAGSEPVCANHIP